MKRQRREDRRVARTKRQLRDALMELILEKGYDGVTIEDVTERADLGRTTFYLHYKDKEELLISSLEAVFDELAAQIMSMPQEWRLGENDHGPISVVFQHAAENATLYRILLRGQGSVALADRVRDYVTERAQVFFSSLVAELQTTPEIPPSLAANYYAGSLMSMLIWWLENDMPYPTQKIVHHFRALCIGGIASALGLSAAQMKV